MPEYIVVTEDNMENFSSHLSELQNDGFVPFLETFRCIHIPSQGFHPSSMAYTIIVSRPTSEREEMKALVRLLASRDVSDETIADLLNEVGYRTPRDKEYNSQAVRNLLNV